jgi:hypothetical protein
MLLVKDLQVAAVVAELLAVRLCNRLPPLEAMGTLAQAMVAVALEALLAAMKAALPIPVRYLAMITLEAVA